MIPIKNDLGELVDEDADERQPSRDDDDAAREACPDLQPLGDRIGTHRGDLRGLRGSSQGSHKRTVPGLRLVTTQALW